MGYNEKDVAEFKRQLKAWRRSYQVESLRAYVEYLGERIHFGRDIFDAIKNSDWPDEKKTRYTNALKLFNAGRSYEEVVDALNGDDVNEILGETFAADTPCVNALYEEVVDALNGDDVNEILGETFAADTPCVNALHQ